MTFSVAFDLSRVVLDAAYKKLTEVPQPKDLSGAESDDDFEGSRNWAVLLVLLSIPVFFIAVIVLLVWLL